MTDIAAKFLTNPRNPWTGIEKIPLDVAGADSVGLASTLKAFINGTIYDVHDPAYGAVGDGSTDDVAAINLAITAANAAGGGTVRGRPGKTYRITTPVIPKSNVTMDMCGATISTGSSIYMISNSSALTLTSIGTLTAGITGPTNAVVLSSVSGLAVGDWVAVRIGNNAYDGPSYNEPRYAVAAKVLAISSLTVTLDWVIPHTISIAGATTANKSLYKLSGNVVDFTLRNVDLEGAQSNPSVEGGVNIIWGVRINLENVRGNVNGTGDMGAGLLGLMWFCRHVRATNTYLGSNRNTRNQSSCGRFLNFSNCIDVLIDSPVAKNLESCFAFLESYCEGFVIRNPYIESAAAISRAGITTISCVQGSECVIENPMLVTNDTIQEFIGNGATADQCSIIGRMTWRGPMPALMFESRQMHGVLDYENDTDSCVVDFSHATEEALYIVLAINMNNDYYFNGPVLEAYMMASAGVTLATITGLYLGQVGDNGDALTPATDFTVGSSKRLALAESNTFGSAHHGFNKLTKPAKLLVQTDGTAQTVGNFIAVLARVAQVQVASNTLLGVGGSQAYTDAQMKAILGAN